MKRERESKVSEGMGGESVQRGKGGELVRIRGLWVCGWAGVCAHIRVMHMSYSCTTCGYLLFFFHLVVIM